MFPYEWGKGRARAENEPSGDLIQAETSISVLGYELAQDRPDVAELGLGDPRELPGGLGMIGRENNGLDHAL